MQAWGQAIQPDAARTGLINQRARLLEQSGQLADAEQALRTSLLTDPAQPDAVQHFVHIRQKMCAWPVLTDTIPGLTPQDLLDQCGPLGVLALTDQVAVQHATCARWLARKTTPTPDRLSPARGYRHERIRIGYMSSDFCRHAMSYLIAELFERHDRDRFEVYGYCTSLDDGSELRRRVIGAFDHYTSIRALSDEAAARRISADEIDILVDLNGLTSGARLQILRWRPAPIQATYLGFIGPVPLPELDYLFCDSIVVPPATAPAYHAAAALHRRDLPGQRQQAHDRRADHADAGRIAGGSFRLSVVSATITRSPRRCSPPGWRSCTGWTTRCSGWWPTASGRAATCAAALPRWASIPERLIFAGRVDPSDYMARLAVADLFLDTSPYNAGTIASDAIRMGLPLLTLSGQSFASRMAGRLLAAIGAGQGITQDFVAYVETAVTLANDRSAYAAYKALFTEARWAETIGDIAGFTAAYEATLLRVQNDLVAGGGVLVS